MSFPDRTWARARAWLGVAALVAGCHDWDALSAGPEPTPSVCVAYVVTADTHTCARTTDGDLLCWGDNRFGQLGTGDTKKRLEPTKVDLGEAGAAKVYLPAGGFEISSDRAVFTCALTTDNAFACWGDNRFGQLGTGDTEPTSTPSTIAALGAAVARGSAGAGHACAQTSDGALWCWGSNARFQLGIGSTEQQLSPVRVDAALPAAVEGLSCGGSHTCARVGPDLYCWGANDRGQVGVGSTEDQAIPVLVEGFDAAVERVSAGAGHTCAFTTDGAVWCWGDNRFGQLGTADTTSRSSPSPLATTGLGPVSQVFAAATHTCALDVAGSLWCWGGNAYGQLGTGDTDPRLEPTKVAVLGTEVAAAYAGGFHTCAVKLDGSVYCWGNNQYGQLGVDVGPSVSEPTAVLPACQ